MGDARRFIEFMRRDAAAAHQFRRNCLALNDLIVDLCRRAQTLSP